MSYTSGTDPSLVAKDIGSASTSLVYMGYGRSSLKRYMRRSRGHAQCGTLVLGCTSTLASRSYL